MRGCGREVGADPVGVSRDPDRVPELPAPQQGDARLPDLLVHGRGGEFHAVGPDGAFDATDPGGESGDPAHGARELEGHMVKQPRKAQGAVDRITAAGWAPRRGGG